MAKARWVVVLAPVAIVMAGCTPHAGPAARDQPAAGQEQVAQEQAVREQPVPDQAAPSTQAAAPQSPPAPVPSPARGPSEFAPLFDGTTLDGWQQRGGKAEYRVESGCIVGTTRPSQPNSFLCTTRDYGDFILELEFKVDPDLNSGVQIRSQSLPDYHDGQVHGYQVEIDPSARAWTGGIYDEGRRGWLVPVDKDPYARAAFKPGRWNTMRVEARGELIRVWINDIATAELRDSMTPRGFIGLQVHGGQTDAKERTVRWRTIRIRPLQP